MGTFSDNGVIRDYIPQGVNELLDKAIDQYGQVDPHPLLSKQMEYLETSIGDLIGSQHPVTRRIAEYYLGGSRIRPMVIYLVTAALQAPSTTGAHPSTPESIAPRERAWWHRLASWWNPFGGIDRRGTRQFHSDATELAWPWSVTPAQHKIGEICELLNHAYKLHQDVVGGGEHLKRGNTGSRGNSSLVSYVPTVRGGPEEYTNPSTTGNKLAILGGDFLLAKASCQLAMLGSPAASEFISIALEHLCKGEMERCNVVFAPEGGERVAYQRIAADASLFIRRTIDQATSNLLNAVDSPDGSHNVKQQSDTLDGEGWGCDSVGCGPSDRMRSADQDSLMERYITNAFYSTGSLLAHSCRASLTASTNSETASADAYAIGKDLGIAMHVFDEVREFQSLHSDSPPPSSLLSAPIILAFVHNPVEAGPLMARRFSQSGDWSSMISLVTDGDALTEAESLGQAFVASAVARILSLPSSEGRSALLRLCERIKRV